MIFSRESLRSSIILLISVSLLFSSLPAYVAEITIDDYSTRRLDNFNLLPFICMLVTLGFTIRAGVQFVFFYFLGCFPVFTYSVLVSSEILTDSYIYVTLYYLFFLVNFEVFSKLRWFTLKNDTLKELSYGVWLLIVIIAAVVMQKTTIGWSFNDFYKVRYAAREHGALFQYSLVILQNVILPFLLWKYVISKNNRYLLGCLFLLVLLFLAAGIRNHIFLFFIGFVVLWALKYYEYPSLTLTAYSFLFLFIIVLVAEITPFRGVIDSFIRRIIFVSGYWANVSFEFSYDASSQLPLAFQMGEYFKAPGHNANMNPFNSGHIELGPVVFSFFITVASILLVYLSKAGYFFHVTWLLFVFSHMRIQSWFLTGGLLVLLILSVFYNEYKTKNKHSHLSV